MAALEESPFLIGRSVGSCRSPGRGRGSGSGPGRRRRRCSSRSRPSAPPRAGPSAPSGSRAGPSRSPSGVVDVRTSAVGMRLRPRRRCPGSCRSDERVALLDVGVDPAVAAGPVRVLAEEADAPRDEDLHLALRISGDSPRIIYAKSRGLSNRVDFYEVFVINDYHYAGVRSERGAGQLSFLIPGVLCRRHPRASRASPRKNSRCGCRRKEGCS